MHLNAKVLYRQIEVRNEWDYCGATRPIPRLEVERIIKVARVFMARSETKKERLTAAFLPRALTGGKKARRGNSPRKWLPCSPK